MTQDETERIHNYSVFEENSVIIMYFEFTSAGGGDCKYK